MACSCRMDEDRSRDRCDSESLGRGLLARGVAQLGEGDGAAPQRLVGEPRPARALGAYVELVVQVRQMLLDRGLRDDELLGDRLRRRRLGEHVAVQQRTAQRQEDVPLARGQRRRRLVGLRHRGAGGQRVVEHQARLADADLVAVLEAVRRPDPLAVDRRAVRRPEVADAPARGEPLQHGVQATRGRVVLERHVVLGRLADRDTAGLQRDPPATYSGDHLDVRAHLAIKPMSRSSGLMSEPLLDGRMLHERYEVLETLGVGGEARVVRALDHRHERPVALKIRRVRDDGARESLLREARLLLGLQSHPALPLVREDFFVEDEYVVAMDWVDGTDLARILAERGAPGLAPSSVVAYLAEAAEALAFLHAQEPPIVHGDVKPANLILTRGGHVKLVDFGLSSTPLMHGRRSGTPGYRAPELATGSPPSGASDVYGLAATAFALLTGAPPQGVLPTWEGIDAALAEQLENAIRLGLATDPARRPASPGELVERLRAGWGATLPTGVTTFCLSDIVSSTALWEQDPGAMAAALVRHDELVAWAVESHGGRFLKSKGEGDATFSVYESASGAVQAAIAATRALGAERWPNGWSITARFGIHTGEAERRDADYFGPTVNLARRVRGEGGGGEILLSQLTAELTAKHLPAGYALVDLGSLHAVSGPGVTAP